MGCNFPCARIVNYVTSAYVCQWGREEKQTLRELPNLTVEERMVYDDLRDNRIGENLRLEQERIGFEWVMSALYEGNDTTPIAVAW